MSLYSTLPTTAQHDTFRRFEVSFPQSLLSDFKSLIHLSKVAGQTYENTHSDEDKDFCFGIDRNFILKAKSAWETEYDWRKTEARINSFPNFKVHVTDDDGTGYEVHFVALFSKRNDAVPIMMAHGWPSCFLEYLSLLDLLRSKYTPESLPYHVVVPSLPGFAFSSLPVDRHIGLADSIRVLHKLMLLLGVKSYVCHGGDLGSGVARVCVAQYKECEAAHVTLVTSPPDSGEADLTAQDKEDVRRTQEFMTMGYAYAICHATVPSTIGLAIASSPIALLAWIGEKLVRWTDRTPSMTTILDFVTLYYLTDTFPRSVYPYRGVLPSQPFWQFPVVPEGKVFGFSSFAKEIIITPKPWAEVVVGGKERLAFYRYHSSGGHFAALEKPKELLNDVEEFMELVRKRSS